MGTRWAIVDREDGSVVLRWTHTSHDASGTVKGETQWGSRADIPNGFDPEAFVDKQHRAHLADCRMQAGQTERIRRIRLPAGRIAHLMVFGGPPTWWTPRFGIDHATDRVEVRAGWLRRGVVINVSRRVS